MNLVPVDDPADPRLEPYLHVRERDLVGRRGLFVAEGEVVLRALVRSPRHRAQSVLLAEKRVEALKPMLADLPAETPVYAAPQMVMDAVAGFHIHRGVLAIGESPSLTSADDLLAGLPPRALIVAAFGIGNHDNIGGIFRNAAAFGADAVLLDPGCCDPLYRKAVRVSVGASLLVPYARLDPAADPLDLLTRHRFEAIALSPAGALPLARLRRTERAALLLGAEGRGLAPDLLARARSVSIPMAPGFDSLNVAAASAVALHHLACVAEPAG